MVALGMELFHYRRNAFGHRLNLVWIVYKHLNNMRRLYLFPNLWYGPGTLNHVDYIELTIFKMFSLLEMLELSFTFYYFQLLVFSLLFLFECSSFFLQVDLYVRQDLWFVLPIVINLIAFLSIYFGYYCQLCWLLKFNSLLYHFLYWAGNNAI